MLKLGSDPIPCHRTGHQQDTLPYLGPDNGLDANTKVGVACDAETKAPQDEQRVQPACLDVDVARLEHATKVSFGRVTALAQRVKDHSGSGRQTVRRHRREHRSKRVHHL